MTTALAAVGYDGPVEVLDAAGEWPLLVVARGASDEEPRALARRLAGPLAPLQRIGLVGEVRVGGSSEWGSAGARQPVRVDERMVVQFGDGAKAAGQSEIELRVAPGLGFGSGLHPGTLACLRQVSRHTRPGMSALDLGCGSGIVSVALAKLGAGVIAVDNDPAAVAATGETLRRNGVADLVDVSLGSLGRGRELGHWLGWRELAATPGVDAADGFDLIAANILSSVHIGLVEDYYAALRSNGVLITAGFTVQQAQDTSDALVDAGLECLDLAQEGEYVALAHRRPA